MKNYIQPGKSIDITVPSGGTISGKIIVIGSLIGVASVTAAEGAVAAIQTEGVFALDKVSALAIAVGDKLYFDAATKLVNKTSSGNTLVGIAVAVAANPSDTVDTKLGPTTV